MGDKQQERERERERGRERERERERERNGMKRVLVFLKNTTKRNSHDVINGVQ